MTATATTTAPPFVVPTQPFALGETVYWNKPYRADLHGPFIVTGVEWRTGTPGGRWYWRVVMVPAEEPDSFPYSPFDVDELAREPWPLEGR